MGQSGSVPSALSSHEHQLNSKPSPKSSPKSSHQRNIPRSLSSQYPESFLTPSGNLTSSWPLTSLRRAIQTQKLAPFYPAIPEEPAPPSSTPTKDILSAESNPNLYSCGICLDTFQGALNRCSSCHNFICTECYCHIVSHEHWKVHEKRRRRKQLEEEAKFGKGGVMRGLIARVSLTASGSTNTSTNRKHSRRRESAPVNGRSAFSPPGGPKCPYCNDVSWHVDIAPRSQEEMERMIAENRRVEELQEEVRVRELMESEEKYRKRLESGEVARLEEERLREKERRERQKAARRDKERRRRKRTHESGQSSRSRRNSRSSSLHSPLNDLVPEEILQRFMNDSDALEKYLTEKAIEESLNDSRRKQQEQDAAAARAAALNNIFQRHLQQISGENRENGTTTEALQSIRPFPTLSSMVIAAHNSPLRRRLPQGLQLDDVSLSMDDDYEVEEEPLFSEILNPFAAGATADGTGESTALTEVDPLDDDKVAHSEKKEEEYDEELQLALALSLSLQEEGASTTGGTTVIEPSSSTSSATTTTTTTAAPQIAVEQDTSAEVAEVMDTALNTPAQQRSE